LKLNSKLISTFFSLSYQVIRVSNHIVCHGRLKHAHAEFICAGMYTGVQDAHNLAWKLHSLLNGAASPSIVWTYESSPLFCVYASCHLQFLIKGIYCVLLSLKFSTKLRHMLLLIFVLPC
jgi:hypothetical protein